MVAKAKATVSDETLTTLMSSRMVDEAIQKLIDDGHSKGVILSLIQYNDKCSMKEAKERLASFEMKKSTRNDYYKVMEYIIDNENNDKDNKKKMAKAIAANGWCSEATALGVMAQMNYIKAYHKVKLDRQ